MTLDYTTAKALKDARFPQEIKNGMWFPYASLDTREKVYIPTLSELIQELGDQFSVLHQNHTMHGEVWYEAFSPVDIQLGKFPYKDRNADDYPCYSTPELACANLYLSIHKK